MKVVKIYVPKYFHLSNFFLFLSTKKDVDQ